MSLLRLPNELVLGIAGCFHDGPDINALHKTAGCLYHLLNDYLYQHNSRYNEGSALLWAIKHSCMSTAQKALEAGVRADEALHDKEWVAPPVLAMNHKNEQIVRLLLEKDLDFSKTFRCGSYSKTMTLGRIILEKAVPSPQLFQLLLDKGAFIKEVCCDMSEMLEDVIRSGDVTLLQALLNHGMSVAELQKDAPRLMVIAASSGPMVMHLSKLGVAPKLHYNIQMKMRRKGISNGQPEVINRVVDQGLNRCYYAGCYRSRCRSRNAPKILDSGLTGAARLEDVAAAAATLDTLLRHGANIHKLRPGGGMRSMSPMTKKAGECRK